jgi:putative ABC transport system permease protein
MGKMVLVCRLAVRDLRRRPAEAVMALLVIAAATTTLTVGLVLGGVTSSPYRATRAATNGPDVVANAAPGLYGPAPSPATITPFIHAAGVTGHSGPYPYVYTVIRANGHTADVIAEGRDPAPARVDQPKVTQGGWVRRGGVVVEQGFADAAGIHAGDRVTVGGRSLRVAGIAVTAAVPAYPESFCNSACKMPRSMLGLGSTRGTTPDLGLAWLSRSAAKSLATPADPLGYLLNLKLTDAAQAQAFVNQEFTRGSGAPPGSGARAPATAPVVYSWQDIRDTDNLVIEGEQTMMSFGGTLLGLLALAGLAVLVGRRMAQQNRRVGLLKAVGGTPGLVAAILLAEHVVVAVLAAGVGLVAGWLLAAPVASASAGLIGAPAVPAVTVSTVVIVVAVALAVAGAATLVPAIRAARTSTVRALADAARAPRRRAWLLAVSQRLPVPLLLAVRVLARRPRLAVLNGLSVAVTVGGVVALLVNIAHNAHGYAGVDNLRVDRQNELTVMITVMLVILAVVNTLFITWATVAGARRASALARAFGATPQQVSAGLSAAQLLPATAGAVIGVPVGFGMYKVVASVPLTVPPAWQLVAVVLGALLAVFVLTAVPSRIGARRPAAEILQSELA